jgi:hypothetical protein
MAVYFLDGRRIGQGQAGLDVLRRRITKMPKGSQADKELSAAVFIAHGDGRHAPRVAASPPNRRIELTMNYYTDPILLDVAGAVEKLPDFGVGKSAAAER